MEIFLKDLVNDSCLFKTYYNFEIEYLFIYSIGLLSTKNNSKFLFIW